MSKPIDQERDAFERFMHDREHPVIGWIDSHWFRRGDDPAGYANEYVQGAWVLWQSLKQPAGVAVPDGLYAIHYRNNWDGEGDTYYVIARKEQDGRWIVEETEEELLQYEGDAILQVWALTDSSAAPHPVSGEQTDAARDVLAERERQISKEGWTPDHDDRNGSCEMAAAAATYAVCTEPEQLQVCGAVAWPWRRGWWKPTTYRQNLVKAGALILAEIERLDRAAHRAQRGGQ